jgi:hypothetical protein
MLEGSQERPRDWPVRYPDQSVQEPTRLLKNYCDPRTHTKPAPRKIQFGGGFV